MDRNIARLLVVFAALAITAVYCEVECYECDYTIIDGNEDGDEFCKSGDDTKDEAKTDNCDDGCFKLYYELELTNGVTDIEVEFYGRGCDEDDESEDCVDESDWRSSQRGALELIWELIFLGFDAEIVDGEVCYCKSDLCNSAPSGHLVTYGIMLPLLLAMASVLKFV